MNKEKVSIFSYIKPLVLMVCAVIAAKGFLTKDFGPFIKWYLILFLVSLCAMPLTFILFRKFNNLGYMFAKPVGISISGMIMWYLSSFKIMKFNEVNSFICVGLTLVISGVCYYFWNYWKKDVPKINLDDIKSAIPSMIRVEFIFLVIFTFWCYMKGFNAQAYGTEKFMDYGYMTAINRTEYMPPQDLWFSGKSINYYYIGQYLATFLTKLSGVGVGYGYNLMLMTLAALSFSLSYAIVCNVLLQAMEGKVKRREKYSLTDDFIQIQPIIGGTLAGLANSIAGNVHYVVYGIIIPIIKKIKGESYDSYWFPDATRYIGYNPDRPDKTIHEFPCYSFVLGDLHAHVINIIFVLTVLGILYSLLLERKDYLRAANEGRELETPGIFKEAFTPQIIMLGFYIGLFHTTNYWDFPIYFVVAGAIILFSNIVVYNKALPVLKLTALQALVILAISSLVSLPFTLNFTQISTQIKLAENHSYFYQLLVLWGLPVITALIFFIMQAGEYAEGYNFKKKKSRNIFLKLFRSQDASDMFIFTITACAVGLIILPEIIYVKDIYEGDYKRSNTMFKLTYQAYIMLSLMLGYAFPKLIVFTKKVFYRVLGIISLILFVLTLGYFDVAVGSWFGEISKQEGYISLDSSEFLKFSSIEGDDIPMVDDRRAIDWLNENVKGTPVVLEANGDSYTYYNRISTFTGLPTILGWRTHEWLWRSENSSTGFPEEAAVREEVVKNIYTSEDEQYVREKLEEYDVSYIVVGYCELNNQMKWGEAPVNEELLKSLGTVVFESDQFDGVAPIYIIKINKWWEKSKIKRNMPARYK
jgi:uncharacterized membrane protein